MSDDQPEPHSVSPPSAAQIKRRAREAAALRANLLRRKEQARARATVMPEGPNPDAPNDAQP